MRQKKILPLQWELVDDFQLVQALAQKSNSSVDFTQLAFTVNVFSVFGTVTHLSRLGDLAGYLWTFGLPQKFQFTL
jgi:hypothetical protein